MRGLIFILAFAACSDNRPYPQRVCGQLCDKYTGCFGGSSDDCQRYCNYTSAQFANCASPCLSLDCADFLKCDQACAPSPAPVCTASCGGCAANWSCFGGAPDGGAALYSAVCLPRCRVTSDCLADQNCVQPIAFHDRVCVAASNIVFCGYPFGPCGFVPYCDDAMTLVQAFSATSFCGNEYVHCDAGCETTFYDGGSVSGRCR
jgi:hypothetical protein